MALSFWVVFVVAVAVVARTGHVMSARWHLGPVGGLELWTVLAFSPEILVFLFFMLTGPEDRARRAAPADALRRCRGAPRRAHGRGSADRVLGQGGSSRGAHARVCGPRRRDGHRVASAGAATARRALRRGVRRVYRCAGGHRRADATRCHARRTSGSGACPNPTSRRPTVGGRRVSSTARSRLGWPPTCRGVGPDGVYAGLTSGSSRPRSVRR